MLDVSGLGLMHPVTRLGRVIQQLQSFAELHAGELDQFAQELERSGAEELARRLRLFRDMQRDEGQMVIEALVELRGDLAPEAAASNESAPEASGPDDPAANSPRRAKWLAEQAAEAERLRQPLSRRDLFGRGRAED